MCLGAQQRGTIFLVRFEKDFEIDPSKPEDLTVLYQMIYEEIKGDCSKEVDSLLTSSQVFAELSRTNTVLEGRL
jgi:hypothetical protein